LKKIQFCKQTDIAYLVLKTNWTRKNKIGRKETGWVSNFNKENNKIKIY